MHIHSIQSMMFSNPMMAQASQPFITSEKLGMYEYLLVVNPGEEINQLLIKEKEAFYDAYQQKIATTTLPHITVANFVATEAMEDTIGRWVQRICSLQYSFTVTLNNYSGFPPHTIYLRIQDAQPFQQLANQLRVVDSYIKDCGMPAARLVRQPHLTLARRLPADVYTKAMFDYSKKDFHESFKVTELVLLRRKHQYDKCQKVNLFRLSEEQSFG